MEIKTVKDLKDYLNTIPDDAIVYEQIDTRGKHIEAVSHYERYGVEYTKFYNFPNFIMVPLTTEPVVDFLKRYFTKKEK